MIPGVAREVGRDRARRPVPLLIEIPALQLLSMTAETAAGAGDVAALLDAGGIGRDRLIEGRVMVHIAQPRFAGQEQARGTHTDETDQGSHDDGEAFDHGLHISSWTS